MRVTEPTFFYLLLYPIVLYKVVKNKLKKSANKFGRYKTNAYLCYVGEDIETGRPEG